jgi:ABC-2 type transport system permease protein
MRHFFSVLRQLVLSYLATALTYRADFLESMFGSALWSAFSFLSAYLVTTQTPEVFGLGRSDLYLLAAVYGIIVGFHHFLCSHGFQNFPQVIHKGELDNYLLKPFDPITFLSLRNINWGGSVRIIGSVITLLWIVQHYEISTSAANWLNFVVLSIPAFFLIYALYTIFSTVLIWHPYLSNILDLVGNSVGTARYPLDLWRYSPKIMVLWFVPFLMAVNIPARAITGRLQLTEALLFIGLCLGTLVISRLFWRKALYSYTSASS